MAENNNTVVNEAQADAAQDTVSFSQLLEEQSAGETVESVDNAPREDAPNEQGDADDGQTDPFAQERARLKAQKGAALKAQSLKYQPDVKLAQKTRAAFEGMSDAQIEQALLEYRARQMAKDDPDMTEKAARQILELRDKPAAQETERESEDAIFERLSGQLLALKESGADLHGMFDEPEIARRIDSGEWDVNTAYAYWQGIQAARQGTEASPPIARAKAGGGAAGVKPFEEMTSEEFAAFSERVDRAIRSGKRVIL